MCRFARSQQACVRSARVAGRRRGQPTRVHPVSTLLPSLKHGRPLRETQLGEGEVFPIPSPCEFLQVPASGIRTPHYDQVHALANPESQRLPRPQHATFVLGFNQLHDLSVSRDAVHGLEVVRNENPALLGRDPEHTSGSETPSSFAPLADRKSIVGSRRRQPLTIPSSRLASAKKRSIPQPLRASISCRARSNFSLSSGGQG